MSKVKFIIFCLYLIIGLNLNGQNSELYFEHINYDEDFSPSMISDLFQSKKGFVWIGTENGLFRYDGYRFIRYVRDKNVKGSLSNNHINAIFQDSEENLWIGTSNGVNLFNSITNEFLEVDIPPIKGGRNYITSFVEDDRKNVWVGTFGGVKKLDKTNYLLENISTDSNYNLNHSRVLSLFHDTYYGILVGTSEGIKSFDPNTGLQKALPEAFYRNKPFLKAKFWKIIKEVNGNLWFASETMGVFYYSKTDNIVKQYSHDLNDENTISSNWVNDIIIVDDSTIWFATNDGLNVYNKVNDTFTRYKHNTLNRFSLTDNNIQCILKDRHGSIWLGTIAGGVNYYNKSNSNFISIGETIKPNFGLNNAMVNAVLEGDDGGLWVGTYGGGLNYLDLKNKSSDVYTNNYNDNKRTKNLITALIEKDRDNLLCGTFNGLFEFNKDSKTYKPIPLSFNGLQEDERPITSLLIDDGNIWIGTNGNGLKRVLKNKTIENFRADDTSTGSLTDNFILDIENREEGLWLATLDGLNYFDKSLKKITKVFRHDNENDIANNSLTVLFTDSNNRLWIGADYDGLTCFDEESETFFVLNKHNGLTDATIKSISEDSYGNLWVSSEDLLFKIKVKDVEVSDFEDSDFEITSYSSKDGLAVRQFSLNCSTRLKTNQLVFGASKGLTIFDPDHIVKSPNDSELLITRLEVNNKEVLSGKSAILNKPIYETSEIELDHDQGYIELEFSSLNFVNPENSKYAYKLDDNFRVDEWHDIGKQNRINLTNLDPGSYTFSVKTTNRESEWNPNIKTLKIEVLPPWWETNLAYLTYAILILGFGLLIIRFINNRIKLKRELYLEHVEKERQQELHNMQLNFFTNVSHEIRTPLTLITGPLEELLSLDGQEPRYNKHLKTIKHNADRLLKLSNELLDFRKAEKGLLKIYCQKQDIVAFCFEVFESFKGIAVEKNIEYKFVLNTNSIQVYFDENQMEKVIYNLLSNAFKFTKNGGKIALAVEKSSDMDGKVNIMVKDNGIGIPYESKDRIFNRFFQVDDRGVQKMGSGVGLALSKSIVELHNGEISILEDTESWATTVFQISLLTGKSHLLDSQIVKAESSKVNDFAANDVIQIKDPQDTIILEEDEKCIIDSNKKTILIAEDNEDVRKFISSILNETYNVIQFDNGNDALEYMEKEIPDLVISDIMMPGMDGLELCSIIKNKEALNHIPVILLTAKSSTANRIEGLSTGADSYISKPFSPKVLKLNVANILKAKDILREKYSGNFIIDSNLDKLETPEEMFIKKLMKIIEANIENPDFDVNTLVDEIGMSRTILYKKVNALTNHSVASLIKQIRLKKAADIILNTSYPISDVAFLVGFNDRKHFSKEFKKVYNFSPSMYKKSKQSV
ncbi:hybrid sensor histidine kinase/response regulator transcription factor [Aestuariivivens sediminis]|uniref:hybrid sensor histidine kinase/response regulator transcription factor n=1 Tax=Aestuariivivens sediminis TaxID=2913557 RepID=UPI001F55AC8F|nr:hybrid sensor histidine kinase/response regulator transcription factor [Aestuariivivens sediminis]